MALEIKGQKAREDFFYHLFIRSIFLETLLEEIFRAKLSLFRLSGRAHSKRVVEKDIFRRQSREPAPGRQAVAGAEGSLAAGRPSYSPDTGKPASGRGGCQIIPCAAARTQQPSLVAALKRRPQQLELPCPCCCHILQLYNDGRLALP